MNKLDVLLLAKKVARDSASGVIKEELLNEGNEMFEPCQQSGVLRRYSPSGAIVEGYLKNGEFIAR